MEFDGLYICEKWNRERCILLSSSAILLVPMALVIARLVWRTWSIAFAAVGVLVSVVGVLVGAAALLHATDERHD